MRALTTDEADVIEAAIEFIQQRQHGQPHMARHAADCLSTAVDLLTYSDGQWVRPTGV